MNNTMAKRTKRPGGETGQFKANVGIELTEPWARLCDDYGVNNAEATRRLLRWFLGQPAEVHERILRKKHHGQGNFREAL